MEASERAWSFNIEHLFILQNIVGDFKKMDMTAYLPSDSLAVDILR
jgi:hypothetical protein